MISPLRGPAIWTLGILCPVASTPGAPQEVPAQSTVQAPSRQPMTLATPEKLAAELVQLMRQGIETKEPNHSFFSSSVPDGGAPFDGSYDWHSSVIAHWALMVHARTTGDGELEAWVMGRLQADVLAGHCDLLNRRSAAALAKQDGDPNLRRAMATFPYDEGWFLVMLAEAMERPGAADLAPLRAEVEARLLDALESRPFPENIGLSRKRRKEGQERYCGFYGSSLILYLQLRWAGPTSDEVKARLDAWQAGVLEPRRDAINGIREPHGFDFLWGPALLALADEVDGVAPQRGYVAPAFGGWPESVKVATVHVLGMELCCVWPLAKGADPDGETGTYAARVNSLLAREEFWSTDFPACSHWVPQFLFIGEWLRSGRP